MNDPIFRYDPVSDYRLIIDLPREVKKKMAVIKDDLDLTQPGLPMAGGQPLIYLAVFSQRESLEQAAVDVLDRIAMGFMPFKVHLKNFGQQDLHEIFLAIEEKKPFEMLAQQLEKVKHWLGAASINKLPRVTLAKNLQPYQFARNWERYEWEHFSATFVANNMLLLKRMEGFASWQILKQMPFQNLVLEPPV